MLEEEVDCTGVTHPPMRIHEESEFRKENYVTTGQAASILKVSVGTVYNLIDQGSLRSYQRGKRGWRMVCRSSVNDLIKQWILEMGDSPAKV
jgi:excisionase family DNA binding protein